MRLPSYDEAQERFIIDNAKDFTVTELVQALGLSRQNLYDIRDKHKLKFKKPDYSWCKLSAATRNAKPMPAKATPVQITRPAAIYDQIRSPYGIATEMRQL